MTTVILAFEGAWKVLLAGLVLGAGLPMLFGLGIRSLAYGVGGEAETSHGRPHPVGRVGAVICFGVVLAAVVVGITFIVASGFGKTLSFEHVYPVLVDKR